MAKKKRSRFLRISAIIAGILLVTALVAGFFAYQRLKIFSKEKSVELLEERFDDVGLEEMSFGIFLSDKYRPGVEVEGDGLVLGIRNRPDIPSFISIERFTAEVTFSGLMETPLTFKNITLEGLQIQIPPKNKPESVMAPGGQSESGRSKDQKGKYEDNKNFPDLYFEEIVADGTMLKIIPRNPDRIPLEFLLHELRIDGLGPRNPMNFEALLDNAKPPGRIRTKGKFGPMRLDDPGLSEVSGEYTFRDADLSVFAGISGILSSDGSYRGTLGKIEVKGNASVPDFSLKMVEEQIPLNTIFDAVVDGTNGNTILQPVHASLGKSEFEVYGSIARRPAEKAKTIILDAISNRTPIEDFIRLAVKSENPVLTGDITFNTKILIPPQKNKVIEKIILKGDFEIDSARFPDPGIQEKVSSLSRFGKGKKAADAEPDSHVVANLKGKYVLEDAKMDFKNISFSVPGAKVALTGAYDITDKEIGFRGELILNAKLSQTQSGIKSFFLKAIDPLFSRDGAGAIIPIKITGSPSSPKFGVEKGRIFSRKSVASPN